MIRSCLGLAIFLFACLAFGQGRYTHLLSRPFADPLVLQNETMQDLEKMFPEIELAFQELKQREQALLQEKAGITALGFSVKEFFDEVRKLHEEGNEERVKVLIQRGNNKVIPLFERYETFVQDYLDATMALVYHTLRHDLASASKDRRIRSSLIRAWESIDLRRERYLRNRHQYGEAKDVQRTAPFMEFFIKTKALYETQFLPRPSGVSKVRAQLSALAQTTKMLTLVPEIGSFLNTVFNGAPATAETNPLYQEVARTVKKLGKVQGIEVEVEDAENLPKETKPNEVNVYIASHRDGVLDQLTIAELGAHNIVPFAAVNNFVPNALNKLFGLKDRAMRALDQSNNLIIVGKGKTIEPIPKALKILNESSVRSFLIFPEGRLPEGLGATAGVRDKFFAEDGLIASIERAGYKVNLIPLSMRHNARLFDGKSLTSDKKLTIRVHSFIDDETRRTFMKYGGETGMAMLLQFGLIDALVTNQRLMFGQLRPSATHDVVFDYLNRPQSPACREMLK